MSLRSGTRIGPYEITAQIGAGGMGEVYRATDVHLKRAVAIKVLPALVADDPERLARFQREAEMLAALNHPNIAQIHGLEKSDGVTALAMELVEGQTLADRIAVGPLPVAESLDVARQLTDALGAAHAQGIIHRDLKPANIKVRPDGTVKVLDFGLAKALEPAQGSGLRASDTTNSPTITSPAMTQAGMILGTAAYMSPEQARGRAADRRADIWAFGCVLFEMLSAHRVFDDEDNSLTLSRVLQREPAWDKLPPDLPSRIRRVLELCLAKDLKLRVGDIHDVRLALDGAFETTTPPAVEVVRSAGWRRGALVAAAVIAAAAIAATTMWIATRPDAPRVTRLIIPTAGATALVPSSAARDLVITPSGDRVAYRGADQIVVRPLDEMQPTVLTGVSGASWLFTSTDGRWVGFSGDGQLKKIAATGGAPIPITTLDGGLRGASWGRDGTIVLATSAATGLESVPADGGDITVLTTPDRTRGEADHLWPEFLPDGEGVLFTITAPTGGLDTNRIAVLERSTRQVTVLPLRGTHARYVPSGHLVYGANGALQAVPFDMARRSVVGAPVAVLNPGPIVLSGVLQLDVATNGTLVYVQPLAGFGPYSLVWVDRSGREAPIAGAPVRLYRHPQLTRDGTRVMLSDATQGDIWILNLSPPTFYRLTDDPGSDQSSTWLADGRVAFASTRAGAFRLYAQSADGSGQATRLLKSETTQIAPAATPDGTGVVFTEVTAEARGGVRLLTLKTGEVTSLVDTRADERAGIVSPDGRWLAFESNRSGRFEVYVQPFPHGDAGRVVPVSSGGGVQPRWAPSGQEIFYIALDGAMMSVPVRVRGTVWAAGSPTRLFSGPYGTRDGQMAAAGPQYDTLDGQRFLMLKSEAPASAQPESSEIIVVQNWLEELKRLVPRD